MSPVSNIETRPKTDLTCNSPAAASSSSSSSSSCSPPSAAATSLACWLRPEPSQRAWTLPPFAVRVFFGAFPLLLLLVPSLLSSCDPPEEPMEPEECRKLALLRNCDICATLLGALLGRFSCPLRFVLLKFIMSILRIASGCVSSLLSCCSNASRSLSDMADSAEWGTTGAAGTAAFAASEDSVFGKFPVLFNLPTAGCAPETALLAPPTSPPCQAAIRSLMLCGFSACVITCCCCCMAGFAVDSLAASG
mmetsp:Transcript_17262/g.27688  ORF Transcript_17262/g.27688 Transcript_17262/m.27688 type:complete len:250 (-) Transcript_17262:212-961(-)